MANTHDYSIANDTGSAVRSDLNTLFAQQQATNAGTSAPTSAVEGMLWEDTTNNILKQYDGSSWVEVIKRVASGSAQALGTTDNVAFSDVTLGASDATYANNKALKAYVGTTLTDIIPGDGTAQALGTGDSPSFGTIDNTILGSGVTFPAGAVVKHQKLLTVISSHQNGTNTYADITGSSITYTPATGADYIVYECSFVRGSDVAVNPLFAFKFLIDGTITKNQDSYAPYADGMNSGWSTIRETHKMVYSASGWTSGKVVKMQFRRYSSENAARLHYSEYDYLSADGGNMGGTDRYTDVITTIYSVMG